MPGQEGHLGRPESESQHLEQRKVLQHIRPDLGLAALDLFILPGRNQLGGDLGFEYGLQHLVDRIIELLRGDDPADQVLDQRLGYAAVDVVVRHLVAHTVRRPAEREFGQIPGAKHDSGALVGEPEQVVGAQTRSTDSALGAGSASVVWWVQAATRTKPCR